MNRRIAMLLGLFACGLLAAQTADSPAPAGKEWRELGALLSLSPEQTAEVGRLARMIESQARLDREQNAADPKGLIAAANLRQQLVDRHLLSLLDPAQTERYRGWQAKRDAEWEFLYWHEGLQLTEDQCLAVHTILSEYETNLRIEREEAQQPQDEPGEYQGGMPGGLPGGLPGQGGFAPGTTSSSGGMDKDRGSWEKRERRVDDSRFERLAGKKDKQVQALLTPAQLVHFKVVARLIEGKRESERKRLPGS